jgi:hypothetical protein
MKLALWMVFALSTLGLGAQPLLANQGHGHGNGNGNGHGNKHQDDDAQAWQQRDGYDYRVYGPGQPQPPGWSHGKKTGWGNCGLPPGQAKKYGCQTYSYQGRSYYYYREDDGRMYVRRPSIDVYGGVSVH